MTMRNRFGPVAVSGAALPAPDVAAAPSGRPRVYRNWLEWMHPTLAAELEAERAASAPPHRVRRVLTRDGVVQVPRSWLDGGDDGEETSRAARDGDPFSDRAAGLR